LKPGIDDKECPHCGNLVLNDEKQCTCGFTFPDDGSSVRGPKAARDLADHARKTSTKKWWQPKKAKEPEDEIEKEIEQALKEVPAEPPKRAPEPPRSPRARQRNEPVKTASAAVKKSRLMTCPSCGKRISRRAPECPKCGTCPWEDCKICGVAIPAESSPCPECGDPDPFNPWES
jgi:hypothetical protein